MHTICSLFVLGGQREGGGSPTPPYPFWSAWLYFSTWERLFLVAQGALGGYVLFSAAITVLRVRKIRALIHTESRADAETIFFSLRKRSARLDKLNGTAFYLFGIVLFLSLQWSYITIDNSKIPLGWLVLTNFEPHFAFAFNVFFIFLILHVFRWFVSSLVDKCALQLGPRQVRSETQGR